MKKSELIKAFEELEARLHEEMIKGSTGYIGKWADVYGRHFLLKNGIGSVEDVRCRKAEQDDVKVMVKGHFQVIEIKTGAGGWPCANADWTEADILPGVAYVAFTCEPRALTRENFSQLIRVFTREQFIEMLRYAGTRGLQSSLKYNGNRHTLEIQAWQTCVRDKKTGKERWAFARQKKCYQFIRDNEIPTMEQWVVEVRG